MDPDQIADAAAAHMKGATARATEFMSQYINEPDHVAVILATSKMDALLGDLVRARLLPCPTGRDELLESERGLSTFSLRISMAHRLGIVDDSMARALHIFRKIRNDFAHTFEGQALDKSPHRERIVELTQDVRLLPAISEVRDAISLAHKSHSVPKLDFVIASALAIARLEVAAGLIRRVDSSIARIAHYP